MTELPLFPLNTVLFPTMALPLHIFEERYRLMIGRCLEKRAPFGVVLIREPDRADTDPDVTFQRVGTAAEISEFARLDDGRYYLATTGSRRFAVQRVTQYMPYIVAEVEWLAEERSEPAAKAAQELQTLYARYWQIFGASSDAERETPPSDPVELSYWMAQRMNVDNAHKQRWLEADALARLRQMSSGLRTELSMLRMGNSGLNNDNGSSQSPNGPGSRN